MTVAKPLASLAANLALPLAGAFMSAVALYGLWDPDYLDSDAAQYLSVARNLLNGEGFSSSIIFYEQQLAFGRVPVPQTVFPPGFPMLLAAWMAAGLEPVSAVALAGIAGHALVAVLLALVMSRLHLFWPLTLLGTSLWLALGTSWVVVLLGRSEIAFTLANLLAAAFLVGAAGRPGRLLAAGAFAAFGVLIRYQGVFFVAALGLWFVWTWIRSPARQRAKVAADSAILMCLPLAVAVWLLIRNLMLAGTPGGGPLDTVDWNAAGGIGIAKAVYWALVPFLGLSIDGLARLRWQPLAAVLGLLTLAVWCTWHARALRSARAAEPAADQRRALIRLFVAYLIVTSVALGYLATRSTGYLQGRFLVPLVPFAAAAWAILIDRLMRAPAVRARAAAFAALAALHAGLYAGQAQVVRNWLEHLRNDHHAAIMRAAIAGEMPMGETIESFLKRNVSDRAPLVATGGQRLWIQLQRPVIEPTPAGFSDRTWDEAQIRRVAACFGARYLLYVPGAFDPGRPENRNQELFLRLARGEQAASLVPRVATPHVRLYEIESATGHELQDAQERRHDDCE